jgi:hypothetical protein
MANIEEIGQNVQQSILNAGEKVRNHMMGLSEFSDLEMQTNLTLYPYAFGGELARVRQRFSALNKNKYYLLLNMLVYGFDNKTMECSIGEGEQKHIIDKGFVDDFVRMANDPLLENIIKKTPAYQKGCFDDYGKFGALEANGNNINENPITGPLSEEPNLIAALLNKIHPDATANLEAFCNKVRTSAFLALPKKAFSSLVRLVRAINGVLAAFNTFIQDIYKGIMYYVQQVFGIINGLLAKLQKLISSFLEKYIPVDLLCILILILQQMAGDIPFFTSLMSLASVTANFEGAFMGYVNSAFGINIQAFGANPLGYLSQYLPPQVTQLVNMMNQFAENPDAYLASMLSNYGYSLASRSTQNQVFSQLLNQYGSSYVSMNLVGAILGSGEGVEETNTYTPPAPVAMGPDTTRNNKCDMYGKPLDSSKIKANEAK